MQFARVGGVLVALLASGAHAAGFMTPGHLSARSASLVGHTALTANKDMPLVNHDKNAGDDYSSGSPLYDKQELRKKQGIVSDTKQPGQGKKEKADINTPAGVPAVPGVPPAPQEASVTGIRSWWAAYHGNPAEKAFWETGLAYFLSYFIMTMFAALVWHKCLNPKMIPYSKDSHKERDNKASKEVFNMGFAYGLFSTDHCFSSDHCWTWCCALCCSPLRLADTYAKQPFPVVKGGFVVSLFIVTCLLGLEKLTGGFSVFIFFCFAISARQKIRRKYNMEAGGKTYCHDCFSWWCCPFCSAVQEARQVDFVYPDQKF